MCQDSGVGTRVCLVSRVCKAYRVRTVAMDGGADAGGGKVVGAQTKQCSVAIHWSR